MVTRLERITGTLYRVGGLRDDGGASVASLAVGPVRMMAGELAASVADTLTAAKEHRPAVHSRPTGARQRSGGPRVK